MKERIEELLQEIEQLKAQKMQDIEEYRIKLLGKKGSVTKLFEDFREILPEQKREFGQKLNALKQAAAAKLEELKEKLREVNEEILLVGDGAALCYRTLSPEIPNLVLAPEHRQHQRAAGVALAAEAAIARGESGDGATLSPNYLRLSQAERERMEKEKREA